MSRDIILPLPGSVNMPKFSKISQARLITCHQSLQDIFNEVVLYYDCAVLCGHRSKSEQDLAVKSGASKTPWPLSKHNSTPSIAVDVVPYPIVWPDFKKAPQKAIKDLARFYLFGGYVLGMARSKGITLRWGGDWDKDWDIWENSFDDLPHFELVNKL